MDKAELIHSIRFDEEVRQEILYILKPKILKLKEQILVDMLEEIGGRYSVWLSKEHGSDTWYCNIGNGEEVANSYSGLDPIRAVKSLYEYLKENKLIGN